MGCAGVHVFPLSSKLWIRYATFLWLHMKSGPRANRCYKKALVLDEADAQVATHEAKRVPFCTYALTPDPRL